MVPVPGPVLTMRTACNINAYVTLLQEVIAAPEDAGAAVGFGLALAAETPAAKTDAPVILWVREASAAARTGSAYGPGLMGLGINPDGLIVVKAHTHIAALRAALEGVRCAALSAVMLETCNAVDLTASRRLKLAAEKSGVSVVLIRLTSRMIPNAAQVRWRVAASQKVDGVSTSLTPFKVEVLKHPAGLIGKTCIMEWDHERRGFAETVCLPLASLPDIGSLAA